MHKALKRQKGISSGQKCDAIKKFSYENLALSGATAEKYKK